MSVVRIAPSPTGDLHVGTARTALFNWLFARHHGGKFILRIEDTDIERSDKRFEENIVEGLKWLGLGWDNQGLYRQSERLSVYREYLGRLLDDGKAFWCHHTIEELEVEKKRQMENKEPPRHVCEHKTEERGKDTGLIIRLAVDEETVGEFTDEIRGPIAWNARTVGDISLAKSLDVPLYNLAVVVDDIEMGITHVIRGEDHISNTPKQILIYRALGVADEKMPKFAHLPLILGPDRSKLSKRNGTTSVNDYKKEYLPHALINFLGLLGQTYTKEKMTLDEMVAEFDLTKVHKSGAIFDEKKLKWLNGQYIRELPPKDFKIIVQKPDLADAAIPLIMERLEKLSDIESFSYFWKHPEYEADLLQWKNASTDQSRVALHHVREIIQQWGFEDPDVLRERLDRAAGENRGGLYWPLRVALSGQKASPDPVQIATVLGKNTVVERIDIAIKKLESEK